MMIHLETLMIWSLTAMTAREAGAHVFARERQNFPPSGEMAPPFGLAPHGSGSAPLRGTFGSTCSASQKTKPSSATLRETFGFTQLRSAKDKSIAHYVRSHKGVCNECMLACARTKDKNNKRQSLAQRRDFCGAKPTGTVPFGASAMGLTLHRALKQRVPCTKACFMIEHAHCVRTKAFVVMLARWRLHKSVFYGNTSCLCSQYVWH
jgi:hypothetical protein